MIRPARAGGVVLLLAIALSGCGGAKGWTTREVPEEYPSIQAAVDAAQPGDLVRIGPGTYREQVVVGPAKRDVVLRGTDRNRVVLDGGNGTRFNGITVHADGVAVENLTVRGFASDAILFTPPKGAPKQLNGWRASYVTAASNGLHGIDALGARGGTIEHVWASGHGAAGLRIGDCRPCDSLVTDSVAERGMAGFEAADSGGNVVVAHSLFRNNRVGVLLLSAGKEEPFHQQDTTIVGNVIVDNANPSAPGHGDNFGVGVLVRGGRRDGLARNRISGHPGAGVLLTASDDAPAAEDSVQGNVLHDNGVDLALAPRAGQRTSKGSCFAQNQFRTSMPADIEKVLPCQSDVPVRAGDPTLPTAPPGVDWRSVSLPAPQPSLPAADAGKPKPARRPGRIDVARVGVPDGG
ncbi:MAG TPA: right-handed parallel beta-helix repeat-containing protein [Baekduia sp.]|nr:right-handed parallel beta-helix repeat-containing protein [Baekduia sp.]